MRKQLHILWAVTLLVLLAGCQKSGGWGRTIRFSARTNPTVPQTKTVYSGQTYSESSDTYERIDWEAGDEINLVMDSGSGRTGMIYAITGVSTDAKFSKAQLEPDSEGGLQWQGEGPHDFWAVYPSGTTVGDYTFSYSILATQDVVYESQANGFITYKPDMEQCVLVAGLRTTPTNDGIDLDFLPAVTTFDFSVGANSTLVITGFQMETITSGLSGDTDLAGNTVATFNPAGGTPWSFAASGTSQSLTASFKDSVGATRNPSISSGTQLRFKVFALPLDITGVRLIFTLGDNSTRSLNLKYSSTHATHPGEFLVFGACRKVNISGLLIPGAEWNITFDGPREERWVTVPDIEISVE